MTADVKALAEAAVREHFNDAPTGICHANCGHRWPCPSYAVAAAYLKLREAVRKIHVRGDEEAGQGVYVEYRGRRYGKGPELWAITRLGRCLNHSGEWEYEPQPSSRDDAFVGRCRWTSMDAALTAAALEGRAGRGRAGAEDPRLCPPAEGLRAQHDRDRREAEPRGRAVQGLEVAHEDGVQDVGGKQGELR